MQRVVITIPIIVFILTTTCSIRNPHKLFHDIVIIIQHLQDLDHNTCNAIATKSSAYIHDTTHHKTCTDLLWISTFKKIKEWAILDSGVSSHFLVVGAPVTNKQVAVAPISVTLTDGDQLHSTHIGELDMPRLPKSARECHIIPDLASYSLISVVKLCEAGCEVSFTK